jgi:beta-phosphoglucomutase-like phosphatase (HAD superfamily)
LEDLVEGAAELAVAVVDQEPRLLEDTAEAEVALYIEDTPRNVVALRGAGCPTIVFGNVTNESMGGVRLTDWLEVEQLALDEQHRWLENRAAQAALLTVDR